MLQPAASVPAGERQVKRRFRLHRPGGSEHGPTAPRDFGPNGAPTTYFTDPDILTVDPLFNQYV